MTGSGRAAAPTLERPRAPGSLGLVQAFVNSLDLEAGTELLASPDALGEWVVAHRLAAEPSPDVADVERAVELREALRDALEANAHRPARQADGAPDRLTAAAAGIPLRIVAAETGPRLEPAGRGFDAALGAILAAAAAAAADGSWARLKVCRNDACRWAYWDASRNRSGAWCSMAICGNRAKGRTFRRRRGSAPAAAT